MICVKEQPAADLVPRLDEYASRSATALPACTATHVDQFVLLPCQQQHRHSGRCGTIAAPQQSVDAGYLPGQRDIPQHSPSTAPRCQDAVSSGKRQYRALSRWAAVPLNRKTARPWRYRHRFWGPWPFRPSVDQSASSSTGVSISRLSAWTKLAASQPSTTR